MRIVYHEGEGLSNGRREKFDVRVWMGYNAEERGVKMRKNSVLVLLVAVLFVGGLTGCVRSRFVGEPQMMQSGGLMAVVSEQELILNSDLIVIGQVARVNPSRWTNPAIADVDFSGWADEDLVGMVPNVLQTDIEIVIEEILFGERDEGSLTVRIGGGIDPVTGANMISEGFPWFREDERVLLFLARDDRRDALATGEDYFVVTGMRQGRFVLEAGDRMRGSDGHFGGVTIGELRERIEEAERENPNWREEREARQEEIRENNRLLFGD